MSKGRCLTKRKWGDFRKSWKERISRMIKFPRGRLKNLDVQHLSMKGSYPDREW